MIHGDGIIWLAFELCPNHISSENTPEKQFQYCVYKKFNVKRHLWNHKRTLESRARKVGF